MQTVLCCACIIILINNSTDRLSINVEDVERASNPADLSKLEPFIRKLVLSQQNKMRV